MNQQNAAADVKNAFDSPIVRKDSYTYEDLIACGDGKLFGPGNALLPAPPMLMFDRITQINDHGGSYGKGELTAEFDVTPDLWFFECHFKGDPVMPGCLGLDALWQLTGFYIGWTGAQGRGRAFGSGDVKFTGMVTPKAKLITYHLNIKRVMNRQVALAFADGQMAVDGETVYDVKGLRAGTIPAEA